MKLLNKTVNIQLEKKVAIFMFVVGFVMMILIPTWQTPDEYTHLNQIGRSIGRDVKFAEVIYDNINIKIDRILGNYDQKVDIEETTESMQAIPEYSRKELMPKSIDISVIKHLPATLGVFFAILLGLPAFWVLQLGELFSLLFYVFVCYRALQIMPMRKELFAMAMLIPMALQQAGSINYDSVVFPLCFYLIAYIFKLKFQEEINLRHFVKLLVIWLLVTYIKMPYGLLILLVFIIPMEKICIRFGNFEINETLIKKIRIPACIFGGIFGVTVLYFLRNIFFIELVLVMLKEWKQSLYLLVETGKNFSKMMITSSVGNFGWLDTPIYFGGAILVYVVIASLAMVNSDEKVQTKLRRWDKVVIWVTAIMLCLFTTIALVDHTVRVILYGWEWTNDTYDIQTALYQIPYIGGIQGRYYLPFVSLLFLPLPQFKQVKRKNSWLIFSIFEVVLFAYIICVLLNRYWIA